MGKDRIPYGFAVASALLAILPFALSKWLWPLTFISLVPFFVGLIQCKQSKSGFKFGFVFGLLYIGFQIFFFYILTARWTGSVFMGLVPWVLGTALGAVYFGLVGWLSVRLINRGLYWVLPFTWVAIEVFRSYIPGLAFPWGLVGTPLAQAPILIRYAHCLTIFGGSFLVASIAALATVNYIQLQKTQLKKQNKLLVAFVAIPLILNFIPNLGATKNIQVLVCQPGVDTGFTEPVTAQAELLQAAQKTMHQAKQLNPTVTVFPEGFARIYDVSSITPPFPIIPQTPVIFGAQRGRNPIYQSAFSYDGTWHWDDKTRLVIFGEYVPLRNTLPFLSAFHLESTDLTPGDRPQLLPVKGINFGPMICFEELFPDISYRLADDGAQAIVVVSDDAWFAGSLAPIQLNQACVWRAIETGLPLIRSGMTGYSDLISSSGIITSKLPFGGFGTLYGSVEVPVHPKPPIWLPVFPIATLILGLFTPLFAGKREQSLM